MRLLPGRACDPLHDNRVTPASRRPPPYASRPTAAPQVSNVILGNPPRLAVRGDVMSIVPISRGVLRDVMTLREAMDRLFEESFVPSSTSDGGRVGALDVDLREQPDAYVLTASVPGVEPDEIDISVTENTVSISAETQRTDERKDDRMILRERVYGRFARTLQLPTEIDPDKVEAQFQNGVLTLRMPKGEASRPRKIEPKRIDGQRSSSATSPNRAQTPSQQTAQETAETREGNGQARSNTEEQNASRSEAAKARSR